MQGLMMDYPLTLTHFFERARRLFPAKRLATRVPGAPLFEYTYAAFADRVTRLAGGLSALGVRRGDRVGTLAWNSHRHLELYWAAPLSGAVLHTVNLRLAPADLVYIINHGGDTVLFVDASLWPVLSPIRKELRTVRRIVIMPDGPLPDEPGLVEYEALLAGAQPVDQWPRLDENEAAGMCYTSGTTGHPKGVLYSHRAIFLHSMGVAMADTLAISERDVILHVVPMFHANAWCFPFTCCLVGAKQVFPGPHLDPESLLEAFEQEKVTLSAGVPTIWMGILQALDATPDRWDLSAMRSMTVGGSAPPRAMLEAFGERHGLKIVHGWGMTEMCPIGTMSGGPGQELGLSTEAMYDKRAQQGTAIPFVEIRARGADGLVPWDGTSMGELEVRGPSVSSSYFEAPEAADRWTDDGWFRTGDIVTIGADGYVEIQDRSKDLVKSGGEWISTVALENALMGHPAVAEAAVIAVPDDKWSERPLAVVVLREGAAATDGELRDFLAPSFAKFWLPDRFEYVDEIPKTAVGKFRKTALREQFASATPVENA